MALLVLAAAASFACMNPAHPSGEVIRCQSRNTRMQLHDIIVPEPAAPCASSIGECPVDAGTAARDHLADLTRGRPVSCFPTGGRTRLDNPPRPIVRCLVEGVDLSCLMVADGFAIANPKTEACAAAIRANRSKKSAPSARQIVIPAALWRWLPVYLVLMNIVTYFVFAADKKREVTRINRISESELLGLIAFGGGIGAIIAQLRLDHMRDQQPFASQMAILIGLQIGAALAIAAMLLLKI
jgi:uncharacterized membrane protein YsdA (DUF1294 family)